MNISRSEKQVMDMIQNPYVGPRFFEEKESQFFFGRTEETEILLAQVVSRRVSLLFSQSGAGKSSLLRAGLLPQLTAQETLSRGRRVRVEPKMRVLPIAMVGKGLSSQLSQAIPKFFIFSALLTLQPQADPNALAGLTLAEGLAQLVGDGEQGAGRPSNLQPPASEVPNLPTFQPSNLPTLLIFDQFEELFTLYPERGQEREEFFRQVNAALDAYPTLHVLFSMREDYIAELTPYANLLPEQLRPRFRLERLKREAAIDAVKRPAEQSGRNYAPGVAEALVDNLRRLQVGQKQGEQRSSGAEEQGSKGARERRGAKPPPPSCPPSPPLPLAITSNPSTCKLSARSCGPNCRRNKPLSRLGTCRTLAM